MPSPDEVTVSKPGRLIPGLTTGAALFTALVAGWFALHTQHVWEDYYITYRSSRNLVEGNGLVYNIGERVHTFTSPLGVLLPAASLWLTGGESDQAALWGFRMLSIAALAGAAVLLVLIGQSWKWGPVALAVATFGLALDAKTVDFTINGMETGIYVLFLVYALWAHLKGAAHWWHLGLAWAGLMWTRPDGFVPMLAMAAGVLAFGSGAEREPRWVSLLAWLKAGALTTLLYLPWFLGAWWYYRTPVPHTITAKGGMSPPLTPGGVVLDLVTLPFAAFGVDNSLGRTFLPAYADMGGWGEVLPTVGAAIAGGVGLLWLWPRLSAGTRLASFVFLGLHAYLTVFPYYPFPWYLPASVPFALLAMGGLVNDMERWRSFQESASRWVTLAPVVLLLAGSASITLRTARQLRAQQQLIETEGRREIGSYLRNESEAGDTVFLEPLGYIGYFSGLRTFDFPGMSSPEMVAARTEVGRDGRRLIGYLRPDWLVLRPYQYERLEAQSPWRLSDSYELVREWDRTAAVLNAGIDGVGYLLHDAVFRVFRRRLEVEQAGPGWQARSDRGVELNDGVFRFAGEAEFRFPVPTDATMVSLIVSWRTQSEGDGLLLAAEVVDGTRIIPHGQTELPPTSEEEEHRGWSLVLPPGQSVDRVLRVIVQSRDIPEPTDVTLVLPGFN